MYIMYVYIYIYIHIRLRDIRNPVVEKLLRRPFCLGIPPPRHTANPRTNNIDVRVFDSSMLVIHKG